MNVENYVSEFLKRTTQIGSKLTFDRKYIFSIIFHIAYTHLKGFFKRKFLSIISKFMVFFLAKFIMADLITLF